MKSFIGFCFFCAPVLKHFLGGLCCKNVFMCVFLSRLSVSSLRAIVECVLVIIILYLVPDGCM